MKRICRFPPEGNRGLATTAETSHDRNNGHSRCLCPPPQALTRSGGVSLKNHTHTKMKNQEISRDLCKLNTSHRFRFKQMLHNSINNVRHFFSHVSFVIVVDSIDPSSFRSVMCRCVSHRLTKSLIHDPGLEPLIAKMKPNDQWLLSFDF